MGVEPWNVFLREIVPRAVLRAEVTDPYDTHMSSLAGMLRRLLVFEPELNTHPLVHAPAAFAVLQPLLAAGILATGLWLLTPGRAARSARGSIGPRRSASSCFCRLARRPTTCAR